MAEIRPWEEIISDPQVKDLSSEEWQELKETWIGEAMNSLGTTEERQELAIEFNKVNQKYDRLHYGESTMEEGPAREMRQYAGDPQAMAFMPGMLDTPRRAAQGFFREKRPRIFSKEGRTDKPYEGGPDVESLAWGGEVPANLPDPRPALKREVDKLLPSTAADFTSNALGVVGTGKALSLGGKAMQRFAPNASRALRMMGRFEPIMDIPSIMTGGATDIPMVAGRVGKEIVKDSLSKGVKGAVEAVEKEIPSPKLRPEDVNVEYTPENWFKGANITRNGLLRLSNLQPVLDDRSAKMSKSLLSGTGDLTEENIVQAFKNAGVDDVNKAEMDEIISAVKQFADPHEARPLWDTFKKKLVTSMLRSVENETNSGVEMAKLIRNTYMEAERVGGGWAADFFRATRGLSKLEKTNLFHVLDGSAKAMNEAVTNAEVEVRDILKEVADMAQGTGITVRHPSVANWKIQKAPESQSFVLPGSGRLKYQLVDENGSVVDRFASKADAQKAIKGFRDTPFMPVQDYVPREVNVDWVRKNMEKVVKYLLDTNQLSRWENNGSRRSAREVAELAEAKINIFIKRNAERRMGHLQIAREVDLPPEAYIDDIDVVMPKYLERAGMRLVEAKNYGAKDQVLNKLITQIEKEGGDALHAQRLVDKMFHRLDYDPHGDRLANALLTYQVITKMPLSQLGQISQQVNALARTNIRSFAKALWYQVKNPEDAMDFAIRAGAGLNQVRLQAMQDAVGGGRLAEKYLRGTGFTAADMRSRLTASLAGRFYAEHLIDKFNKNPASAFTRRRLAQLGIDPDGLVKVGNKYHLTDMDLLKAGQKAEIDTNFRNRIIDLPDFATDRWGRLFWQFHTFAYQQTKFLNEFVVKEARHGNILPMVYLLSGAQMTGEFVNFARDTLQGKEHDVNIWRNWATAGTFGMFESLFGVTKYNNPTFSATVKSLANATIFASKLFQGEIGEGFMTLLDEVPTARNILKNVEL